jgi:hypothetical protein
MNLILDKATKNSNSNSLPAHHSRPECYIYLASKSCTPVQVKKLNRLINKQSGVSHVLKLIKKSIGMDV